MRLFRLFVGILWGVVEEVWIVQEWDRGVFGWVDESILGVRYRRNHELGCDCREYRFEVAARSAAYRAPYAVLRISGISKSRRELRRLLRCNR